MDWSNALCNFVFPKTIHIVEMQAGKQLFFLERFISWEFIIWGDDLCQ